MPNPNTDNDVLLLALQAAHPDPVWNPNSKLGLTAHSRVSELRKLGWEIECVRRSTPKHAKKRKAQYGYVLHTPRSVWPQPDSTRVMKLVQMGRVVA
jgi:hypothetical protein